MATGFKCHFETHLSFLVCCDAQLYRSRTLNTILIIGLGDIGQRLSQRWLERGYSVQSLSRSAHPATDRHQHRIADLDEPLNQRSLQTREATIYYLAPPANEGRQDARLDNFLNTIADDALPRRLIYISTSGVYGDHQGGMVDESTPARPQTARSQRRWAAEQAIQHWAGERHIDSVVLRVGGIYGPGRLPLQRLEQGLSLLKRELCPPTNRIHADDLAQICVAAARAPAGHQIYNVCDMQSSSMTDYFCAVAKHAGLPPPREIDWQQAEAEISPAMMSYLRESRRMSNDKMLRELNIKLRYPSLSEGLKSMRDD